MCSEGKGNLNLERLIISLVFCPSADCSSGRGALLLDYICMSMNGHKELHASKCALEKPRYLEMLRINGKEIRR